MPYRLAENLDHSFIGSYVLGLGFILEPDEAKNLLAGDPKNSEVLFPYLSGQDLNASPTQQSSRWIINFHDWSEERAREYAHCFAIVEEKVRPERQRLKSDGTYALRSPLPQRWWHYADKRPALYATLRDLDRAIAMTIVSRTLQPALVDARQVFMHKVVVFAYDDYAHFGLLSSTMHWLWAVKYTSTLGSAPNYSPSDVFDTLAQPSELALLAAAGERLHLARARLMLGTGEGLTKVYGRMHARGERHPEIEDLRRLHIDLDDKVASSYGWNDVNLDHGFHPTSQGERFTISPAAQEEILDRLLELNHERHAAEVAGGLTLKRGAKGKRRARSKDDDQEGMFE